MITKILPMIGWFKGYDRQNLKADFISGLTVALVLIPQSHGLCPTGRNAFVLRALRLFSSSHDRSAFRVQPAVGNRPGCGGIPDDVCRPRAAGHGRKFGIYRICTDAGPHGGGHSSFPWAFSGWGLVVNFLSHPVVNGFTNAAAIIIASSQLSKLFGVYVDKAAHHYETIIHVVQSAFHYTHWPTLIMGALAFGIMYGLKKIAPPVSQCPGGRCRYDPVVLPDRIPA